MLTMRLIVSQIRSEVLFIMINLKDTNIHITILSEHREILRGGQAYQYQFFHLA